MMHRVLRAPLLRTFYVDMAEFYCCGEYHSLMRRIARYRQVKCRACNRLYTIRRVPAGGSVLRRW